MATALQVILTEDSEVGQAGELKKVRPGFARNYLLPQGKAVLADAYNMHKYEEHKAELEKRAQERREKAEAEKEAIGEEASVTIETRAGESGKLFGAITKEKIAEAVTDQLKVEVVKDQIKIKMPIKAIGEHQIALDLGAKVETNILVKVVSA